MPPKKTPKVSVIMNCFNCEKYLREAIDSVYAQTYKGWEIIFWDNASMDKSAEIAKGYDGRTKYFRGEKNVKLYHARNFAISKATGEYVAFLDCDDLWLPGKLEKQVAMLEANRELMLLFSNYFTLNEADQTKRLGNDYSPGYYSFEDNLYDYKVGILTAIVRKESINKLDYIFDETLSYSGDYDFFMRILASNLSYYMAEPLAIRRAHGDNYSLISDLIENRNEILYVLDKLQKTIPEIKTKYLTAFNYTKRKIILKKAYSYFMGPNAAEVRDDISQYKYSNLRFFTLYLVCCIPYYIYIFFKQHLKS